MLWSPLPYKSTSQEPLSLTWTICVLNRCTVHAKDRKNEIGQSERGKDSQPQNYASLVSTAEEPGQRVKVNHIIRPPKLKILPLRWVGVRHTTVQCNGTDVVFLPH